jgi:tetratricopeptide (TPR) repeat protein
MPQRTTLRRQVFASAKTGLRLRSPVAFQHAILLHRGFKRWLHALQRELRGVFFLDCLLRCATMNATLRANLLFRYAQFLTIFGLRARAHEFIQLALRQNPRHQRAWTVSAFMNAEKGRLDAAIKDFEQALALKPGDADTIFNLGFILQGKGEHEAAVAHFQRATQLNPFLDRAWYGEGLSLSKLGRYQDAAAKFGEAARLQPMNPYAAYHLAGAWSQLGDRSKLEAEYQRVKGFDPKMAAKMQRDFGAGQTAR